jgi:hypothetical protein
VEPTEKVLIMIELDFSLPYKVDGYDGVAWRLLGYFPEVDEWGVETGEYDEDSVFGVMIGDDRKHLLSVDSVTPIEEDSYCHSCGQIGCNHG